MRFKKIGKGIITLSLITLLGGCSTGFLPKSKTFEFPYNTHLDNQGNIVYTVTISADSKLNDIVEHEMMDQEERKKVDIQYLIRESDVVFKGKYKGTIEDKVNGNTYERYVFEDSGVFKYQGRTFDKPLTLKNSEGKKIEDLGTIKLAGTTRSPFKKGEFLVGNEYAIFAKLVQFASGKHMAIIDYKPYDAETEKIIKELMKQEPNMLIYDSQVSK